MYVVILDHYHQDAFRNYVAVDFLCDDAGEPKGFVWMADAEAACQEIHEGPYTLAKHETRRPSVTIVKCNEVGDVDLDLHVQRLQQHRAAELRERRARIEEMRLAA